MVSKHRVKSDLRKKQRHERLALIDKIDQTSDVEELLVLQEQLLDQTNRHRAEKEGMYVPKLSIEEYRDLQAQGLKDKDIAKRAGMPITSLYTFKSANGLTTKRKASNEPVVVKKIVPEVVAPDVKVADEKPVVAPVAMPTIPADDWAPQVQSTIDTYFDKREQNKARKAQLVDMGELVSSITDQSSDKLIEQQYKIDELERTVKLWKERHRDTENKFFDLSQENRKLDTDFRDLYRENQRLQDMIDKMKQTKLLNYLLMKDSVSMIEQLDTMAEKKEVGEFVWR